MFLVTGGEEYRDNQFPVTPQAFYSLLAPHGSAQVKLEPIGIDGSQRMKERK